MELVMAYEVLAGIVGGKTAGQTLTDEDLATANIDALIASGSIKPITAKPKKDEAAE